MRDSLLRLQIFWTIDLFLKYTCLCARTHVCVHVDDCCAVINTEWNSISGIASLVTLLHLCCCEYLMCLLVCSGASWVISPIKHHSRKTIMDSDRLWVKAAWIVQYKIQFYMYYFILECKCSWQHVLVAFKDSAKCMRSVRLCLFQIQVTETSDLGVILSRDPISHQSVSLPPAASLPLSSLPLHRLCKFLNSVLHHFRTPTPEWFISNTTVWPWYSPDNNFVITSYYVPNQAVISQYINRILLELAPTFTSSAFSLASLPHRNLLFQLDIIWT